MSDPIPVVTTFTHLVFSREDIDEHIDLADKWRDVSMRLYGLHANRLRDAAEALGYKIASPMDLARRFYNLSSEGDIRPGWCLRQVIRVVITSNGDVDIQLKRTTKVDIVEEYDELEHFIDGFIASPLERDQSSDDASPSSEVVIAVQPTEISLYTQHKTGNREPYDIVRREALIVEGTLPTAREVLLYNVDGEVMEASVSAVYFLRKGQWVTPSASCGGMNSVTKLHALQNGWCQPGIIDVDDVEEKEVIWLSNAVRGFFPGIIQARREVL